MILETIITKFYQSWYFQIVVCIFCAVNFTGSRYWEFRSDFNLLNKTEIVEIWKKILFISGNIETTKRQTTLKKSQDQRYFVIIISKKYKISFTNEMPQIIFFKSIVLLLSPFPQSNKLDDLPCHQEDRKDRHQDRTDRDRVIKLCYIIHLNCSW